MITTEPPRRGRTGRTWLAPVVTVLALLGVLGGCSAIPGSPFASPVPFSLAASVPAGAADVAPSDPVVVSAAGGQITSVTVTPAGAAPLAGTPDPSGTRWTSARLAYDTEYRVQAAGVDSDGRPGAPIDQTFRTVEKPEQTLEVASIRPTDGQTVGVAMPISITFDAPVGDRAAVERRVSVTTSVPTEGSFHWMSDEQLNWRPKEYWRPGTQVTVDARLFGVAAGRGLDGGADTSFSFTVGRDQRVRGDVNAHTLVLSQDGREVRTLPASFGRPEYPTQSGIHVAFEKYEVKRMRSESWGGPAAGEPGFYDEELPFAVRISNNGEFVHVNAATVSQQGRSNVSHGCANVSPADGEMFFNWVQMGDPVEIVGSERPLTPADGDIADWTIPWEQYRQGSALA
ncbi:L,D-transpeptidase 2 [Actinomycetospora sp. NBRC 106375]|uniref:L,D-transpeptidase n=1 Tax=Actinomycetospora sp. NBRC 106375 TaxID=3032207 RepID=UPI0024A121C8|nr:Ig-like domain-containing protein [Actinomycetospora sp. NBRC 106375]GLZ50196.1 L,D-transpeptidase 2 [Actinomycetospora sp. NBRC 106375]